MPQVTFKDLGLIDYQQCWDYQQKLFDEVVAAKRNNRACVTNRQPPTANHLLFCEHPHVYTLGKSGSEANLLANEYLLNQKKATFHKINRGGDITYHGPGQLVGYPILDLDQFFTDVHKYLRFLEEAIITTLAEYGITASRYPDFTGVWLEPENPAKARKIAALGVRMSRWVTMHGFAFNVNTDLSYFNHIIPCGISDKNVTSLQKELGRKIDMKEVKEKLKNHLAEVFEMELVEG